MREKLETRGRGNTDDDTDKRYSGSTWAIALQPTSIPSTTNGW
jgi:hypothetical protein